MSRLSDLALISRARLSAQRTHGNCLTREQELRLTIPLRAVPVPSLPEWNRLIEEGRP